MSDFIELDKPKHNRDIRKIYTPKEVVGIIQKTFIEHNSSCRLNRSEMLLIWEFGNRLIGEFKDD